MQGGTALTYPWYAIRTKSNHEKAAFEILESKGYETFWPRYSVRTRWSDRVVESQRPLFSTYLFCRFDARQKAPVVSTPGVVGVVGFGQVPAAIPDSQVEAVQRLVEAGVTPETCKFFQEGQRVRIKNGVLSGAEGILVRRDSNYKFIVSIEILQRSVSVSIDPVDVEKL